MTPSSGYSPVRRCGRRYDSHTLATKYRGPLTVSAHSVESTGTAIEVIKVQLTPPHLRQRSMKQLSRSLRCTVTAPVFGSGGRDCCISELSLLIEIGRGQSAESTQYSDAQQLRVHSILVGGGSICKPRILQVLALADEEGCDPGQSNESDLGRVQTEVIIVVTLFTASMRHRHRQELSEVQKVPARSVLNPRAKITISCLVASGTTRMESPHTLTPAARLVATRAYANVVQKRKDTAQVRRCGRRYDSHAPPHTLKLDSRKQLDAPSQQVRQSSPRALLSTGTAIEGIKVWLLDDPSPLLGTKRRASAFLLWDCREHHDSYDKLAFLRVGGARKSPEEPGTDSHGLLFHTLPKVALKLTSNETSWIELSKERWLAYSRNPGSACNDASINFFVRSTPRGRIQVDASGDDDGSEFGFWTQ
ncbi:hypothetical protein BJ138DRAFT_1102905 [Hygrophoropsis aurantiaca]|uniref:Uncharacterized protein n=1 Tax=Hygrophoropsis aurantiaca TaxID=72124 RepID=A0ACB8A8W8_9AGAM|nr:hypothetical protein BJ138DRAFT_1102905 [Hygrophoropsis aurantiaca]